MISYVAWQKLPLHLRILIANQFGIAKVGPTHVIDNKIASDGYLFESVETALTDESMKEFTGTKGTSDELFSAVVSKVSVPVVEVPKVEPVPDVNTVEVSNAKPEKNRIPKKTKKK